MYILLPMQSRRPQIGGAPGGLPPSAPYYASRPVSRVLYGAKPNNARFARDGHSSGTPVARRLEQPTRAADPDIDPGISLPVPPLFGLAPGGVCRAASVAGGAGRSCRTVSPLPRDFHPEAVCVFCGTFPGVTPAGRYPAPHVHGARTFLPGDLSVRAGAAIRPTDGLGMGTRRRRVKSDGGRCCRGSPRARSSVRRSHPHAPVINPGCGCQNTDATGRIG